MRESVAYACLDDRLHGGFIVIRSPEQRKRGVLLLNVSETEARIKFLPGYVSASLFSGPDGVVAEYVQWRTEGHLGSAFTMPAFAEHLPVVRKYAHGEMFMFGTPTAVIAPDGSSELPLLAHRFAIYIFIALGDDLAATEASVADWAGSITAADGGGALVIADPVQKRVGLLLLGDFEALPPVPERLAASVIERAGPLELYCSVTAPDEGEEPLDYAMVMNTSDD